MFTWIAGGGDRVSADASLGHASHYGDSSRNVLLVPPSSGASGVPGPTAGGAAVAGPGPRARGAPGELVEHLGRHRHGIFVDVL
jgi:hypothetical protein